MFVTISMQVLLAAPCDACSFVSFVSAGKQKTKASGAARGSLPHSSSSLPPGGRRPLDPDKLRRNSIPRRFRSDAV
jgi:hypothetical protein